MATGRLSVALLLGLSVWAVVYWLRGATPAPVTFDKAASHGATTEYKPPALVETVRTARTREARPQDAANRAQGPAAEAAQAVHAPPKVDRQPATQPAPAEVKPMERPSPPAVEPKTPAEPPPVREHVVQSGDTLSGLAKRFYGSEGLWEKIYEANKGRMKGPDDLKPGMRLLIPN